VNIVRFVLCLCLSLSGSALAARTPEKWFETPKSLRIANYRIRATLDWEHKTLEGQETISWRNEGWVSTQELPLHLYLNAFKGPQTIFSKEGGWNLVSGNMNPASDANSWGYCELQDVRMEGQPLQGHFGEDETVYWLRLPRPVLPGETIRLDIRWEDRFPRVAARSGWSGKSPAESRFLMAAQWFPKVGVYQNTLWNCQAYHANTEFFADFGVYEVELSVPKTLLLAHTGLATNANVPPDPNHPGYALWQLHAEDVHDFAWAAAPAGTWDYRSFENRNVQVRCYFQKAHLASAERQIQAVKAAMRCAEDWYLPYPYPVLSILDVPDDAEGADAMEYPTLFTASAGKSELWGFKGDLDFPECSGSVKGGPELVSIHEFGHQYFQGMLASNEVEEPWLDEGITSWFTEKVLDHTYQALYSSRRFQVGTNIMETADYWNDPSVDPMAQTGFQTYDTASYVRSFYSKPVLVLNQLEALLGRPVMEEVMRAYVQEMAFKHPTQWDFKRIAERVSGHDLDGFWKDFVEGTETLDVVIHDAGERDAPQGGWIHSASGHAFVKPQSVASSRTGYITLFRRGGISRPITLWVRLENRLEHRMTWDGKDRWITYEFDSPVTAAILDPEGRYPILKDRLHGTYTSAPVRKGFHYWAQMIWGALTALLQGAGLG
jgi:hypothetical protein